VQAASGDAGAGYRAQAEDGGCAQFEDGRGDRLLRLHVSSLEKKSIKFDFPQAQLLEISL
jgi:hypothetical protein